MRRIFVCLAAALLLTGTVHAAQVTGSLTVQATVGNSCAINSTTPVTFIGYDGLTDVTAAGSISVTCTSGLSYNIALDAGANFDGIWRNVNNGSVSLPYVLEYTGAEWGDSDFANTYASGTSVSGTGTGGAQSFQVDGTLTNIGSLADSGNYSDTVVVTVIF